MQELKNYNLVNFGFPSFTFCQSKGTCVLGSKGAKTF